MRRTGLTQILIAVACLALGAGCWRGNDKATGAQPDPPASSASAKSLPEIARIDDPWLRPNRVDRFTGDLDALIERGALRLLTPANRTHFFVDGARERGVSVEIARVLERMLAKRLGKKDQVRVVVIPVRRDELIPLVESGFGDVAIGNLTVTPERQERVDFSPPLVSGVRELVVTAPDVPAPSELAELSGREIWVRRSSSYHASLDALNRRFVAEGKQPTTIRFSNPSLEDEGILEMVRAGLYPATVVDSHKLEWVWGKVFDELQVTEVAIREKADVAAAFRKGSPQLADFLAEFQKSYRIGTAFGNQIVTRYWRKSHWLTPATSTSERRKFDALEGLFKKYAERYNFDHLMLVAQGYQESRLDQSARSPVGAIGIMQLMPQTAAGPPLNMPNVDQPEDNIHAGAKYLRFVIDRYFDDPEIDDVNRHLFALAAYNAGPNRIARLRKLAPEYGVDSNLWFGNVERIVARKVSREPVRYVANIYRYYLGYRRLRELRADESVD